MDHGHADVSKHVKAYLGVFGALAVFTVLTVLAAKVEASTAVHVLIALLIASVKASLVAAVFMHLKWERGPTIWWTLAICAIFFAALLFLPVLTTQDNPPAVQHSSWG